MGDEMLLIIICHLITQIKRFNIWCLLSISALDLPLNIKSNLILLFLVYNKTKPLEKSTCLHFDDSIWSKNLYIYIYIYIFRGTAAFNIKWSNSHFVNINVLRYRWIVIFNIIFLWTNLNDIGMSLILQYKTSSGEHQIYRVTLSLLIIANHITLWLISPCMCHSNFFNDSLVTKCLVIEVKRILNYSINT